MKKNIFKITFCALLCINLFVSAQDFAWRRGTKSNNASGIYGLMGVPAPGNNPGGREGAVTWKDNAGNFWLFGGYGSDVNASQDFLNDLWQYDPITNEWTWINGSKIKSKNGIYGLVGIADPSNGPGSRADGVTWVDSNGDFWMFGGYGYDISSSVPNELNDLWRYNIINNEWTWMGGSNTMIKPGIYGTQGIPVTNNIPGSRYGSVSWTDLSGTLWLFGGYGYDGSSQQGSLNDLWKYNRLTNMWTWVSGSSSKDQNGTYGSLGIPASSNQPGGRNFHSGWRDLSGNFWLHGGIGFDASGPAWFLNDLWKFDPINEEWTWINGDDLSGQAGSYGVMGTFSSGNYPGARYSSATWVDASGSFWLFGGNGMATVMQVGFLNDLWKYDLVNNEWAWFKGNNNNNQPGIYGTADVASPANKPGARLNTASWIDNSSNLYLFGGQGYNETNLAGELNDMWKLWNCKSTVKAVSSRTSICSGETVTLTAGSAATYTWNNGLPVQSILVSPKNTTTYSVEGMDNYGCDYSTTVILTTKACTGLNTIETNALFSVYPNPTKGEFKLQYTPQGEKTKLFIYTATGLEIFDQTIQSEETMIRLKLPAGLYHYSLVDSGKTIGTGKIVLE